MVSDTLYKTVGALLIPCEAALAISIMGILSHYDAKKTQMALRDNPGIVELRRERVPEILTQLELQKLRQDGKDTTHLLVPITIADSAIYNCDAQSKDADLRVIRLGGAIEDRALVTCVPMLRK